MTLSIDNILHEVMLGLIHIKMDYHLTILVLRIDLLKFFIKERKNLLQS